MWMQQNQYFKHFLNLEWDQTIISVENTSQDWWFCMPSVKNSVGVDNNQLQDQACDPFVMIEQGFKSNLISKYPKKLLSN